MRAQFPVSNYLHGLDFFVVFFRMAADSNVVDSSHQCERIHRLPFTAIVAQCKDRNVRCTASDCKRVVGMFGVRFHRLHLIDYQLMASLVSRSGCAPSVALIAPICRFSIDLTFAIISASDSLRIQRTTLKVFMALKDVCKEFLLSLQSDPADKQSVSS